MAYEITTPLWHNEVTAAEAAGKFVIIEREEDPDNDVFAEEAVFVFDSEAEYEAAEGWSNDHSKADIIAFCESQGVSLDDSSRPGKLRHGWATLAMVVYANSRKED